MLRDLLVLFLLHVDPVPSWPQEAAIDFIIQKTS